MITDDAELSQAVSHALRRTSTNRFWNNLQSASNAGEYYTPRAVTAFMVDRIDPKPGEILLDPACGTGGFLTCALRHMRDRS